MWAWAIVAILSLWIWVRRGARRRQRTREDQPARLAGLARDASKAGFEKVAEATWTASLPIGAAVLDLVDLVYDEQGDAIRRNGVEVIGERAYVTLVVTAEIPFVFQLYRRWLWDGRGLERRVGRALAKRYLLHVGDPASQDAAVGWLSERLDRILELRPSRIYANRCRCGRGHASHVEVILDLASIEPEAGQLALALELVSELIGAQTTVYRD